MAPTITRARLGSQLPKTSRKFNILAGFTICETTRPRPKTMPEARAVAIASISTPDQMTEHQHRRGCREHEDGGCREAARREPGDAADAMAAGAAVAEPRAEADQQAAQHEQGR